MSSLEEATYLKALMQHAGLHAISSELNAAKQLRIMGRVPPDAMYKWKAFLQYALLAQAAATWKIDLSKSYFLRGEDVVYAWRVIVQNPSGDFLRAVEDMPTPAVEIMEVALPGVAIDRNSRRVRSVLSPAPGRGR